MNAGRYDNLGRDKGLRCPYRASHENPRGRSQGVGDLVKGERVAGALGTYINRAVVIDEAGCEIEVAFEGMPVCH